MAHVAKYRADIDGLRAIAVVAVLLFHLGVPGLAGGFVGVDVFFVISGYLITGLVLSDLERGKFSLKNFYLRRIRRLLPALLTVLVPTTIGALFILYPEDLRSYATSLSLQFAALQNFFFLADGEYFRNAETKPLLHTWTLAVEEQFYLFWPLLLLLLRRWSFGTRMLVVSVLMFASFGLSQALMVISPKASFFLLPPRAWEMGAGGVLAMLERRGKLFPESWGARIHGAVVAIGLGTIAVSVALTREANFPGWVVLAPVIGTVLVIAAGSKTNLFSGLLSLPAMVHLGKISYPVYLWHWPLISFAFLVQGELAGPVEALVIGVLTIVLGDLTCRFVEDPIRGRKRLGTSGSLLATVGAVAALLIAVAVHSLWTSGAVYRYPAQARAYLTVAFDSQSDRCGIVFRALNPKAQVCALHEAEKAERRVLVWGNSHADMWTAELLRQARTSNSSLYLNARNCRAVTDSAFCGSAVQRQVLSFIEDERITDVILASTWYGAYEREDSVLEAELEAVVEAIAAKEARVWFVLDVPNHPSFDPQWAYQQNPSAPTPSSVPRSSFFEQRAGELKLFERLRNVLPPEQRISLLDPNGAYCGADACLGGDQSGPFFRDANHVSNHGAALAGPAFAPVFALGTAAR